MASKNKIAHSNIAFIIVNTEKFITLKDTDAVLWYNTQSGLYEPGGEIAIKTFTQNKMSEIGESDQCTTHFVNEVINDVRRRTYIERTFLNPNPDFLNLRDRQLVLSTRTLVPHSSGFKSTIGIPVGYDPEATCPTINRFFNEIVKPADVPLLYEIFGWCIDRASTLQKLVFFLGSGANGKSTYLNLLKEFLGPANCSHVALQSLTDNRFSTAQLEGKLANIFPDLPAYSVKDISVIKGLTGHDAMSAENKFEKPFSFTNTAKMIFSANKAPDLREDTDALWRRLVILEFPFQFMGTKDDHDLIKKLTTPEELSGLLNAALDGFDRIKANHTFTHSGAYQLVRRQYLLKSNPVPLFIEEACELTPTAWTSKEDLHQAFMDFAEKNHAELLGKAAFGRKLNVIGVVFESQDSWSKHGWKGIRVKVPSN